MARVAVAGVGMAPFGRHPERSATSLGVEAVDQALADAGLAWRDVQTMYCGVLLLGLTPGTRISEEMGFTGIPVVNIDNASASGSSAFREAYLAVATEQVDVALAVGVGKAEGLRNAAGSFPKPGTEAHKQAQFLRMQGLFAPMGIFAMRTRRRMHDYGSRIEQLAMVAVKNRKHASLNPYAQLRKPQTLEDVMNARMVCDPLTVPHCCPIGDGASAAIVVSEKKARELGLSPMVTVEASVFRSPASSGGTTSQDSDTTARTAREAYEQAGMGPEDISLVLRSHGLLPGGRRGALGGGGRARHRRTHSLQHRRRIAVTGSPERTHRSGSDLGDDAAAARAIGAAPGRGSDGGADTHGGRRRSVRRPHPETKLSAKPG